MVAVNNSDIGWFIYMAIFQVISNIAGFLIRVHEEKEAQEEFQRDSSPHSICDGYGGYSADNNSIGTTTIK